MTFEEALTDYATFRLKLIPITMTRLPDDPAQVWEQRAILEGYYFEALEFEALFESFHLTACAKTYEDPECGSWESALAKNAKFKLWARKSSAAVKAIEARGIKLSQNLKISESK